MKILILGGTGAMGKHLVELLQNEEIYVTSRKKHKSTNTTTYLQGDAHNLYFLKAVLTNYFDVIIDFMFYNTEEFKERCRLLLNSCNQYIYLSSSRVYSNTSELITESTPTLLNTCKDSDYLATDEYALTKARQENILQATGKNWTIIRPYITYSENRLQLGVLEKEGWLYRALHGRTIIFSQDIAQKTTTLTYGLDVAKGISALINRPEALCETYHITASKGIKWEEVLTIYLDVFEQQFGYRPKIIMTERAMNLSDPLLKYQVTYDRLHDRLFNNAKIGKFIDTSRFITPQEGLRKCTESFLKHPYFSTISGKFEGKKDRLSNETTSYREFTSLRQKIAYLVYRHTSL